MRVRDRGFALILVLLAVAAVFALSMQGAAIMRTTTLEASVVRDRTAGEIGARGAVVLAIKGILAATPEALRAAQEEADSQLLPNARRSRASRQDEDEPKKPEQRELPPIIKALLGDKANDVDQGVQDLDKSGSFGGDAEGFGMAGRMPRGAGYKVIQTMGVPTTPIVVDLDGRRYSITLGDAQAAISVNVASEDQLFRYFVALGLGESDAHSLTDQILDWIDEDSVPRTHGAEQQEYTRQDMVCRNGPFASIEELLYLPAMTRELFERVRWDLRVGEATPVHVGSASFAVLASIEGVGRELAETIVEKRGQREFSREMLEGLYPIISRDELKKTLRFEPSGVLRVQVEMSDIPVSGSSKERASKWVSRFEGLAIIDDRGIREIGLRAAR